MRDEEKSFWTRAQTPGHVSAPGFEILAWKRLRDVIDRIYWARRDVSYDESGIMAARNETSLRQFPILRYYARDSVAVSQSACSY